MKIHIKLEELVQKLTEEIAYEKDMIDFHNAQITTYKNVLEVVKQLNKCCCGGII